MDIEETCRTRRPSSVSSTSSFQAKTTRLWPSTEAVSVRKVAGGLGRSSRLLEPSRSSSKRFKSGMGTPTCEAFITSAGEVAGPCDGDSIAAKLRARSITASALVK